MSAPTVPATATPTRGIFDPDLLSTCISCGYCLPACPTYALTGDERSSPRGRITLMRALEAGRLDEDDPTLQEQASYCLGCRACESVCPAGVKYGELLEQWRDHQWRGRHGPVLAAGLRLGVRRSLPLRAAGVVRGHARTTGPARPSAGEAADTAGPAGGASQESLQLMLGCFERSLFPGVSKAVARLLPGIEIPSGQGCCGALHAHNGDSATGAALAEELGRALPRTILTTAGGCAAHLVHHLGRDRVRELSEYLSSTWVDDPESTARLLRPLRVDGRPVRVTVQDSCHLRNGLGTHRQPRAMAALVAEVVELPSAGSCCGAAGTYSLVRPRDSAAVLAPKLDEIEALGVDHVVAVNPICQRQLINGLRKRRSRVTVVHLAELLARALPPS
jgi:glycolate oxidase iron-sulfur subunit